MKKKMLCLLLAAAMSASMIACGENGKDDGKAEETTPTPAEEEKDEQTEPVTEEPAEEEEEPVEEAGDDSGLEMLEEGVLVDIAKALSEDDRKAALELMNGEAYAQLAHEMAADTETDHRIYDTQYGPIGAYHVQVSLGTDIFDINNTFIYFGEYKDGLREGEGVWVEYAADFAPGHSEFYTEPYWKGNIYDVSWENDLPEGDFVLEGYDENFVKSATMKGSVVHGLYEEVNYRCNYRDDGSESASDTVVEFENGLQCLDNPTISDEPTYLMDEDRYYCIEPTRANVFPDYIESIGGPEGWREMMKNGVFTWGILGFSYFGNYPYFDW
ncbi:MAG: hypothetical protein K6E50_04310 [Lachnospiraceae bacterium]|nr:hypothetical protein [Lachnospiraceae bacterium]